jgi:hypothetical protein
MRKPRLNPSTAEAYATMVGPRAASRHGGYPYPSAAHLGGMRPLMPARSAGRTCRR